MGFGLEKDGDELLFWQDRNLNGFAENGVVEDGVRRDKDGFAGDEVQRVDF